MAITIAEITPEILEAQAILFLKNTDWMVWKSVEDASYTVPVEVKEKRAFARTLINTVAHKAALEADIRPIFYDVADHLVAFQNLIVHKSNAVPTV